MVREEEKLQDEPIEIGGREDDAEDEQEFDEPETDELDDDGASDDEEESDDEDDGDSDDADDDTDDEDEGEDSTDEQEPTRVASVKAVEDDIDVQVFVEEARERREEKQFYLDNARNASPDFLKYIGVDQFNFTMNGQRVDFYGSSDAEFDRVIEAMEDDSNIARATIRSIMRNRERYQAKLEVFEAQVNAEIEQINTDEWTIILNKAPQYVQDNWKQIADYLQKKAEREPMLERRAQKFKGKVLLVNEAVKALKLDVKQSKSIKTGKKRPEPAIHNQRIKGKGRKTKKAPRFTQEQIDKMSLEEFEKHQDAILKQKLGTK